MRKVLMVTPHFPPDAAAGAHRVRLLAPYLRQYGWDPTVLTCEPDAYEGKLDPALLAFVPASLRVVRARAWSPRMTRPFGIGDLGLRSFVGLERAAAKLLTSERFDALFITIFPGYTALLGPRLTRRFQVPFVLDYQDPWVNAWGADVGGAVDGRPDVKSRLSRRLAEWLEPKAVRHARAITAVSAGTYEPILRRHPEIDLITAAIPIGAEPKDFTHEPPAGTAMPFDPQDGRIHVCYTGTILPKGIETLRAFLRAVSRLRETHPDLYARLRVHFIGTSNQHADNAAPRVLAEAAALGISDVVHEIPSRLPYSAIVHVQRQATVLVALGSSEPHYTASKIFPLLLAQRPLLAVYHEESSVIGVIDAVGPTPSIALVTYADQCPVDTRVDAISSALARVIDAAATSTGGSIDLGGLRGYLAETLAGQLAGVLNRVVEGQAA
jgi:glycosyltransferase involved in cell wall biosynthesis